MSTTVLAGTREAGMPAAKSYSIRVVVSNDLGLHARPAALLVSTTRRYDAEVMVGCDGHVVSGKSIMGILTLGAGPGSIVTVTAEGHDARQAIRAIEQLFACSFHEQVPEVPVGDMRPSHDGRARAEAVLFAPH